jgi:DNA phosphorothioation-dependent restriction protein DptF
MGVKLDFLDTIGQLKESSKHAIINGEVYALNQLKEYLHIQREVEVSLSNTIESAKESNKAQLILVCGNVGDGKSHVISYLNKEISSGFKIHNDATESFNPDESFTDTLDELLQEFQDDRLKLSTDKTILAINLGTLNNFLDVKSENYQKLKTFVTNKGILDSDIMSSDAFDSQSYFQYVNFTDYQLYELTENGITSNVIEKLFDKIFSVSKENPIYSTYLEFKESYWSLKSPIIYNYDFLCDKINRRLIVNLIVKAIVKNKGIISLRSILNFTYDLIIPVAFQTNDSIEFKKRHKNMTAKEYSDNIILNYIFEYSELSNLFSIVAKEDPCNIRSATIDDSIVQAINTEEIQAYAKNTYSDTLMKGHLLSFLQKIQKDKLFFAKLHTRLLYFKNNESYGLRDKNYSQYINYLYHINKGNKSQIKDLYNLVINACRKWNGDPNESNSIIIDLGQKQKKYRILQDFNPTPRTNIKVNTKDVIRKFSPQLKVNFVGENGNNVSIYVDFSLFELLNKVNNGYRPNKLDKASYINFINFLDSLIKAQSDINTLKIDEVNIGDNIDYTFSIDSFEEYTFEKF